MGVQVKCYGYAGVTQALLDDLGVDVLGEHKARMGVSGIVKADTVKPKPTNKANPVVG